MSNSSHVTVNLKNDVQINILEMIQILQSNSWSLVNRDGKICYTPLGDNEACDWTYVNAFEEQSVIEIIKKKQALNEAIGVTIVYIEAFVEMNLCFFPTERYFFFSLICDEMRPLKGLTNFYWYRKKLTPLFKVFKKKIASITFAQYDTGGETLFHEILLPENVDEFK
jgi:hypothetical protein